MKLKKELVLYLLLISILLFTGCESNTTEIDSIDNISVDEQYENNTYKIELDIVPNGGIETVEIIRTREYSNILYVYDNKNNLIFQSDKFKLQGGKIEEIKILDFNRDNLKDILISLDTGGSGGVYLYELLSYNEGKIELSNFEDFDISNICNIEVKSDRINITINETQQLNEIVFNEDTISTLKSMNIDNPSNYFWNEPIISNYYNHDSELILVTRDTLMLEHKLLTVAEVKVEYRYREGKWMPYKWNVEDIQFNESE